MIKLSILVPTKNRADQLDVVLRSFIQLESLEEIEVVVQDNSNVLNKKCVSNVYFPLNLKYFYKSESIAISDNIQLGLDNCSGAYILIVGDDDFVHPNIIQYVNRCIEEDIEILTYSAGRYWWPNVENKSLGIESNSVWLKPTYSSRITTVLSSKSLTDFEQSGCVFIGEMPRGYHGIVKACLYQKLRKRYGSTVLGSSPDIAIAIALSLMVERFSYIEFPLTFYGASKNSGGGYTVQQSHHSSVDKLPFLRDETKNNWPEIVPRYWTERIIYLVTYLEVMSKANQPTNIFLEKFYARALVEEFHLRHVFLKFLLSGNIKINKFKLVKYFMRYRLGKFRNKYIKGRDKTITRDLCPNQVVFFMSEKLQ